jgi:hypothetical protein
MTQSKSIPILLTPLVEKTKITKDQYATTLPAFLQPFVAALPYVWQVIVTPQKNPESTAHCRVFILAGADLTFGALTVQNAGRMPATAPPETQDDLRPIKYFIWGNGKQGFKVVLGSNSGVYQLVTESFE